eukprot:8256840-Pyramimonas_sp.AAC.1
MLKWVNNLLYKYKTGKGGSSVSTRSVSISRWCVHQVVCVCTAIARRNYKGGTGFAHQAESRVKLPRMPLA